MLSSLLDAAPSFNFLSEGYEIGLDFLGQFAKVIIQGCGIIGVGIIVFTLVLKAITLPFDIYQRVKMRKQNLIMREMQPELERLQQQYANDKTTYNQKMTELYKKNGYSMLAACLPMIISLVILIVAFQGFRSYSQYANLSMYERMSVQYNAAVRVYCVEGEDFTVTEQDFVEGQVKTENGVVYKMYYEEKTGENNAVERHRYMEVKSEDASKYLYYIYSLEADGISREYKIDKARLYDSNTAEVKAEIDRILSEGQQTGLVTTLDGACEKYVKNIGAKAAADWYRGGNDAHFLWVRNIWYPDVSYNHPIQDYETFKRDLNVQVTFPDGSKGSLSDKLNVDQYEALTAFLTEEKSQPNGYFILIILSIGLMVLSQFISMRSQKETNKYQTVDGKGGMSQKVMLVVMPLIYAIFAFMYSAAFSIYMVMSSLISLLVTLLCNFILGRVFRKKEEKALQEKYTRTLPWQRQNEEQKGKKDKKKNKGKK